MRVILTVEVEVIDQAALARFVSDNHESWGLDDPPDMHDAVYECLVACGPVPPLDMGLEIVNHTAEIVA